MLFLNFKDLMDETGRSSDRQTCITKKLATFWQFFPVKFLFALSVYVNRKKIPTHFHLFIRYPSHNLQNNLKATDEKGNNSAK